MNKLKECIEYAEFTENSVVCLDINYAKKLLKQHENPTLEEVKQEWEELGYKWEENEVYIHITKRDKLLCVTKDICLTKQDKEYCCYDEDENYSCLCLTFQEHQLLTKTFRALGWEV